MASLRGGRPVESVAVSQKTLPGEGYFERSAHLVRRSVFGWSIFLWVVSTLAVLYVHSEFLSRDRVCVAGENATQNVQQILRQTAEVSGRGRRPRTRLNANAFSRVRTEIELPELPPNLVRATNYGLDGDQRYNLEPSSKCPLDKTSISPCTCRSLASGITVECEGLQNSQALSFAFIDLRRYVMHDTVLIAVDFQIENEVFDNMNFIILTFRRGDVKIRGEPGSYSLAKLDHTKGALQQVNFMQCKLDLGTTTLSRRPLQNLELFKTTFENYNDLWFKNLRVRRVRINSRSIKPNVTEFMLGITHLIYSNAELKELNRTVLPRDVSQLKSIDFSTNGLTRISEDFFKDIPHLEEVILKGNHFETIDENVFKHLRGTVLLNFEANTQLRCAGLEWLRRPHDGNESSPNIKVKGDCLDQDDIVQRIQ